MMKFLGRTGRIVGVAAAAAMFLLLAGHAMAQAIPAPQGKPILVVSGKIGVTNLDGKAQFDRATLESLGMQSVTTWTPWYKESMKFEGIPLKALMAKVGASGTRLRAVALNDYSAEIPMEDVQKYNILLALKRNGEYMPVRDKGPLFVVYPFDSEPDLKNQKYYSRCVWQVDRIEVN